MKFMKLGSKPDSFQAEGNSVRYVASDLPTDIVVNVGEVKFYLHKFPLLSKSIQLQNLVLKACEESANEVHLYDFPGGPKSFEICAKFCYGMTVTLNAYNIVAARCAAEYLQMTEDIERGNLIFKIEVFLNSSVFRSWKDSIIVLQTTKFLLPWSEDLKIVGRCIDSIASKTSVEPSSVNWSYTYGKNSAVSDQIVEHSIKSHQKLQAAVPKDWWVEDICDLDIDHYKKVMIAIKAKGRMSADVIGEALRAYVIRWLPNSIDDLVSDEYIRRNRCLVETIIWLMPSDKGSGCSCSFLMKLLKVVMLIGAEDPVKEELQNRISTQLDKVSVRDILIPARPPCDTVYDVHLVQTLVSRFVVQDESDNSNCVTKSEKIADEFILGHASLLSVGKLVDGYLMEIASDVNLSLSGFMDLAGSIPVAARPVHDGLYAAIDIYLMGHPGLTKAEKKRLCSLMDVKKLSTDACVHAAQNERLPLRVVVQVLFFEQVRTAAGGMVVSSNGDLHCGTRSAAKIEDWERPAPEDYSSTKKQSKSADMAENECSKTEKKTSNSCKNRGNGFMLPSRSRRIFDRLWVGKVKVDNNRSSETSGSSQSPPPSQNPRETKSSSLTPRQRRYSVS
uniref:BTB/POZ domain-containing protein NPY1 n=2 Tax=Anthurium amnicola TaxID=1678845 RepID=A0A1D1YAW7_9ARAE